MSFLLSPARAAPRGFLQPTSAVSRSFSTTRSAALARMTLIGRVGTDPEAVTSKAGTEILKYSLATSYGPKDNRQTSWYKVATFVNKESPVREKVLSLAKGTLVYLEADAMMKSYEDADGKKQSSLSLVQTKLDILKRPTPRQDAETGTGATEEGESVASAMG